jgi:hypothetical protein
MRLNPVARGIALLGVLLLSLTSVPADTQQKATTPPKARRDPAAAPAKTSALRLTFQVGEKLEYRVVYAGTLHAAVAELEIPERRSFHGVDAWHFKATARTVDLGRVLYELDDQFDSYSDAARLTSLRYERYLRERGEQQNSAATMSTDGQPLRGEGPFVRVAPGTFDAVGYLFFLRAVDWRHSRQVRSPVYDGQKIYEVQATAALTPEQVQVPAGLFSAAKVHLKLFDREKEVADVRLSVWLAQDARRAPVLMEAELPFGKLRIELTHIAPH